MSALLECGSQDAQRASGVSTCIQDHYAQVVKPRLDEEQKFYSQRYFVQKRYLHGKYDEITPDKQHLFKLCPRPRITAFSQGSVYFPYEDREEVLRMIAYDIQTNSTMYWNQIAYLKEGEGCRLVVDVDSNTRILSNVEIHKIAKCLWQTLKAYYTNFDTRPIDIMTAKCGPRIKKGNLSTGVHIVCHVNVTLEQARQIIYGLLLRLHADHTFDMKGLDLDDGIYKSKAQQCSMRMVYCHKIEKCPLCEDTIERRQSCDFCGRRGEVISKSSYEPLCAVDPRTGQDSPEYFGSKNENWLALVHNYSIWPEEDDMRDDYVKPMTDPEYTVQKRYQKEMKTSGEVRGHHGSRRNRNKPLKKLRGNDPSYELLQEWLHQLEWKGKRWWQGIDINRIELTENKRLAWVFVTGMGSTFCPYVMRGHTSNRIWLSVSRKGVLTFYCHSKKDTRCGDTKNRVRFDLPGRIPQQLFKLSGPPSLNHVSDSKDRTFSFQEFVQRKGHASEYHMRPKEIEAQKKQRHLMRLSEFYQLNNAGRKIKQRRRT